MFRRNRRTSTDTVRDNSIYGVSVRRDGFTVATLPFHYRRRFTTGRVYTGPCER